MRDDAMGDKMMVNRVTKDKLAGDKVMGDTLMGDKMMVNRVTKDKLAGDKVMGDTLMGDKMMRNKNCNQDGRIHGAGKGNNEKQKKIRENMVGDKMREDGLVRNKVMMGDKVLQPMRWERRR